MQLPFDPLAAYPAELLQRAAGIRLACFDVDGTLTDGRLWFDEDGRESKAFSVVDGQGLVQLRRHGIPFAFVTARQSTVAANRGRELGAITRIGVKDKVAAVLALAGELGLTMDQIAFMGDDLVDIGAMQAVGLAIAPANVHAWTRPYAHWITQARGGEGAAREVCDLLLLAHGHLGSVLGGHA